MCMKCGCSIPNDKKSTKMVLPNKGGKGKSVVVKQPAPKPAYGKRMRNNA